MTDEWKPGDRVQLMGTVLVACSKEYMKIKLDGSKVDNYVETSALAAGKRLPRQFKVGDEVEWASSPRLYTIVALDGNAAAIVSHDDHPFREWAYLSDLRPAPVKP